MDAGKICTMSINYYKPGDWNAICDSCGFKFKASQLRKRWDEFMVCENDWETRHPQELIRAPIEKVGVEWTRPEAPDVEDGPSYISESSGNQETTIPSGTFDGSL